MMLTVRNYTPEDRSACLAVFDSNVPEYFAAHERSFYESYLDKLAQEARGPYLVLEDEGEILGCGGMVLHEPEADTAELAWGIIARRRHKSGLGRLLLFERLKRIGEDSSIKIALANTSQFTAGFFTRMGFETRNVIKDGYFEGMDKYEMTIPMPFKASSEIQAEKAPEISN